VTINEEDENENGNGSEAKEAQTGNDVTGKEPVPDIEDTVADVDMKNRKMEALDKIRLIFTYFRFV
jgi:hypothetical protein